MKAELSGVLWTDQRDTAMLESIMRDVQAMGYGLDTSAFDRAKQAVVTVGGGRTQQGRLALAAMAEAKHHHESSVTFLVPPPAPSCGATQQ